MDSQDLISVIVPVYKVEKYLDRCVDSIVNQTYRNLEIILVDDGSPDKCPKLCDDWAEKDSRIKVIHKENGGLSDARNAGMKCAKGLYLSFIDSDDYIELDMISKLYNAISRYNCDIASCGVRMIWDDKPPKPLTSSIETKVIDSNVEAMAKLIEGIYLIQTVWNKLYRRATIENLEFPVGRINEDEFWSWKAIANANRVICLNERLYNYYLRQGSIMQGGNDFNPMHVLEAKSERQDYIEVNMPELKNLACIDLLYTCLFQAQRANLLLTKEKNRHYYKEIKSIVNRYRPDARYVKSLGIKKQFRIISISRCFDLVCFFQNILGIGTSSNI